MYGRRRRAPRLHHGCATYVPHHLCHLGKRPCQAERRPCHAGTRPSPERDRSSCLVPRRGVASRSDPFQIFVTDLSTSAVPTTRALDALAAVIAEFNAARPLETSIAVALDALRRSLDARECSLWLHTADGLVRTWVAGEAQAPEAAVAAALGSADEVDGVRAVAVK